MSETELIDTLRPTERWHSLVMNMPGFVVISDRNGAIKFINRVPEGFSRDQIPDSSISNYVPCRYREIILDKIALVFKTGKSESCEIIRSGGNGSSVWWSARLIPVSAEGVVDELLVLCTDLRDFGGHNGDKSDALPATTSATCVCTPRSMTKIDICDDNIDERMRSEAALSESEEKFRNLAEHSLQGLLLVQEEAIIFVNQRAADIAQIPLDEFKKMTVEGIFQTLIHPDDRQIIRDHYDRRMRGEPTASQYEIRAKTGQGNERWAEISAAVTVCEGKPAIQIVLVDVTARKEAEAALQREKGILDKIISLNPYAISVWDADGHFVKGNKALLDLFKVPPPADHHHISLWNRDDALNCGGALKRDKTVVSEFWFNSRDISPEFPDNSLCLSITDFPVIGDNGAPELWVSMYEDITSRRRTEVALRESEEKYRTLVESASNAIFSIDYEGTLLFMNHVAAHTIGGKPEDFVGRKMTEFFPPDIGKRQLIAIRRVIDNGKGEVLEAATYLGGVPKSYVTSIQPLSCCNGRARSAFLIATDITERVETNRQLTRERDFTRSILETANSLIVCLDDDARITVFNEECELVTGHLRQEVLGKRWPEIFMTPESRHEGLSNFGEWVRRHPHDRYEGSLVTKTGEIRTILWSNSSFISAETGNLTAIAIGHDITEAKRAREQLLDAESKYRNLVEQLPAITYTAALNAESTTLFVSPQAESMLGFSPAEYAADPDTWRKRLHPDDRERVLAEVARCHASGEPFESEYRMISKDGRVRWFRDQAVLVRDSAGIPKLLHGIQFDITERKRAEEELLETKVYLDKIINSISDPIFVKDRQHRFVLVNEAQCRLTGYSREELIGKPDRDFFPKEQVDVFWRNDELVFETGIENVSEETVTDAEGVCYFIVTKKTLYIDKFGNKFIVGIIRDITRRKKVEEELKESQRRLLEAQRVAQLGNWEWDVATRKITLSDQIAQICGSPPSELEPNLEFVFGLFHPEERERLLAAVAEISSDENNWFERYSSGECRIIRYDGAERIIHWRMEADLDDNGKPIRTYGVVQDITERKQMEVELREVNRQLREEQQALTDKNIALKEVLGQIKEESNRVKLQIKTNLEHLVMPTLLRMKERARESDKSGLKLLESLLAEVVSPFVSDLEIHFGNLTPREAEVCSMIKNGMQSKEIALALGISVRTVEKFRQKIRIKMGIDKSETNLITKLRSL